ncbi:MAG: tetratricopeptide repeat protein [Candidatus Cloacimonetes bacterium]|nr:tetratricopeptide repeat protein [Candidatus Cloacimonadota bacterium]
MPDQVCRVADLVSEPGHDLLSLGTQDKAESLFTRALAMKEADPGNERPDLVRHLNDLAGLNLTQGELAREEELARRSLGICRKIHGEPHSRTEESMALLASVIGKKAYSRNQ